MKKLDLDLTFPALGDEDEPYSDERVRTPIRPPMRGNLWLFVIAVGLMLGIFAFGHAAGSTSGNKLAAEAIAEAKKATATAGMATDYAYAVEASLTAATERITALETVAASATAEAALYKSRYEDALLTIDSLRTKVVPQSNTRKAPAPAPSSASGAVWSRSQVASTIEAAAREQGLTAAQTAWLVDAGCRIAYAESRYRTNAVNASNHAGLFQFSDAWGVSIATRCDPVWSCYRFVRVYAESGEAGIRRHWGATV